MYDTTNSNVLSSDDRRIPLMLLTLALPIIASMVSRTVMNLIDFVMVTQLGTEAQAAIMPAGMVLFCIIGGGMGLLSTVSTYVSQSLGRNKPADCSSYAWQGVHLSIIAGIVLLPAWWLMPLIFSWADHGPVVMQMENAYAQIGVLGLGPTLIGVALTNFYNGIHRPMVGLVSAIIANIFNIFANYALIFGHWGFEPMGVAGAAWATQAAALLQALILMGWMLRPFYLKEFHTLASWRPNWGRMGRLLWLGAPAGFQFATDIGSFTIFTIVLVGQFGTVQLAAHNLAFKFLELSFMPTVGLGIAISAAVGKAIGASRPDRARRIVRWGTFYAMTYMGFIGLCYVTLNVLVRYVGPEPFRSWLTQDPAVIVWTSKLLLFCAVFQLFDAVMIIHVNALRGAGDNHVPAIMSIVLAATVFLTGGYLLARWLPSWTILGPWTAATVYICLLGVVMGLRWRYGPWEKINLHQHEHDPRDGSQNQGDPAVAASQSTPLS